MQDLHPGNEKRRTLRKSKAIMVLDHSRVKTNQAEFFAFDKFTLQKKSRQQIWGCVNQSFILLINLIRQAQRKKDETSTVLQQRNKRAS